LFLTRFPATDRARERGLEEAIVRPHGEEGGVVAQTPPTQHRPGTCYPVAESRVTVYGKSSRAGVVHASRQEQRRHKVLARERQASSTAREATGRTAAHPEYVCRADAEAAAAQRRAQQSA